MAANASEYHDERCDEEEDDPCALHEFRGREWEVAFTYLTATPQHLSFSLEIGRDGKLKKVRPVHGWD